MVKISVEVGERVALQPIPDANYRDPHEPAEIAAAVDLNRGMGQRIVDRAGTPRLTSDLVNKLINAMPENGIAPDGRQRKLRLQTITPIDTDAPPAPQRRAVPVRASKSACRPPPSIRPTLSVRFWGVCMTRKSGR